jgi:hypothetical protein
MQIGVIKLELYGDLKTATSVEQFISSFSRTVIKISPDFIFDYRKFASLSAVITFEIPIKIFTNIDSFYKTLKKLLDYNFLYWEISFQLTLLERSD